MSFGYGSFPDSFCEQLSQQQGHHDERRVLNSTLFCGCNGINPTVEPEQQVCDVLQNFALPKTNIRDYKISFEESFMEEHESAFEKQTENFIEQFLNDNQITDYSKWESIWWEKSIQNQDKQEMNVMLFEEKNQFLKQISKHEKLTQFFQKVQQKVSKLALNQFYYLGYLAWQKYLQIKNPSLNQVNITQQCINLAEQQHQKLFKDQRIKFLNLKQIWGLDKGKACKVKEAFKNYLSFFFTTFMLITEEYFSNPYSQGQKLKRDRPQSQNWQQSKHGFFGLLHKRSH